MTRILSMLGRGPMAFMFSLVITLSLPTADRAEACPSGECDFSGWNCFLICEDCAEDGWQFCYGGTYCLFGISRNYSRTDNFGEGPCYVCAAVEALDMCFTE